MTIDEEYTYAFGRVTWSFSDFEYHYRSILIHTKILDVSKTSIITRDLPFGKLVELTNELLCYEFKNDKIKMQIINELYQMTKEANRQRNEILHSFWLANSNKLYLYKYNLKKYDIKKDYTSKQINETADLISKTDGYLVKFIRIFEPNFR